MLSPRWKKVVRDITSNKSRSMLVVASIAIGVFAVGVVQHLRTVVLSEMQKVYDESDSAHGTIVAGDIDDELIEVIRRMPNVAAAEGRGGLSVSVEVEPGKWEQLSITAVTDFEEISVNLIKPVYELDGPNNRGAADFRWPQNDELLLERSSFNARGALPADLQVGDQLTLQTSDEKIRTATLTGFAYDPNGPPAAFRGQGTAFVNFNTFEKLGGSRNYSQVNIRVVGTQEQILDQGYVTAIADDVAKKIEKSGRTVRRIRVFQPGRLPLQDLFDSISLVLTPLGILALILGSFLVINTMSALMLAQTRQIGIMKSIGAVRGQIFTLYVATVFIYSVLALLVAIPLTLLLSSALESFLGTFINVKMPGFVLPLNVFFFQVAIGLLIPMAAAFFPIIRGTGITVREAISDFGVGKGQFGTRWLDMVVSGIKGVSRPVQISLRNTIRRRARLILTLITLTLGGMIFMTVGSVRSSLENRIEEVLAYNQFDVRVQFERAYRTKQITNVVETFPGATNIESWSGGSAFYLRPDGTEGSEIDITALPAESTMVSPTIVRGRWISPDDENAVVLAQSVVSEEPEIDLGSKIILEIDEKPREWIVVGFAQTVEFGGNISAYVNYPYYVKMVNQVGTGASALIQFDRGESFSMDETIVALEESFAAAGLRVGNIFPVDRIRDFTGNFFSVIISLLLVMGVLIASVGALGLAGTMSTNVLERTREIGVLRAIGASDGAVLRIVIVEGILIGMISWIIGAMLAFPIGFALSNGIGLALFKEPLTYVFSSNGVFTWLAIVIVLAIVASFLPARSASRLTVREVLAYE